MPNRGHWRIRPIVVEAVLRLTSYRCVQTKLDGDDALRSLWGLLRTPLQMFRLRTAYSDRVSDRDRRAVSGFGGPRMAWYPRPFQENPALYALTRPIDDAQHGVH